MALKTMIVNGETAYFDGNKRISKADYIAKTAQRHAENVAVTRTFKVSLNGRLTEVTDNGVS